MERILKAQYDAKKPLESIMKTVRTGERYVRNIAQSKQFSNDIYQGRGLEVARGRGYSQNTYMGYNKG